MKKYKIKYKYSLKIHLDLWYFPIWNWEEYGNSKKFLCFTINRYKK